MKNFGRYLTGVLVMLLVVGFMAGSLSTVNAQSEYTVKIKEALKVMQDDALKLGEPKAEGSALYFGTTKMNGNYTIVDALKTSFACTATFFVKKGDAFIRISTNVQKEGNRAVGTPLDPNGPAYAAVSKGEAFYGVVDILGKKYDTGYEPIKNTAGEVVGVYYIGYLLDK